MIVVAGGSGTLGRLVVGDLLAHKAHVRVIVRNADKARRSLGGDVDVVQADVRSPSGLDAALSGASVLISAVHGFLGGRGAGPEEVDDRGNANLTAAARSAGARVVMVSALEASPASPVDLFRSKFVAEQRLRTSGVPWTIVRPAAFFETWLGVLAQTAGGTGRPLIFGRGDQPILFVSAIDVAAVVTRTATDPAFGGEVIELAGEPFTMQQLSDALQAARGWRGAPRHVPRTALRAFSVLAAPVRPAFARQCRTALAMDTGELTVVPASDPPLGMRMHTLQDVLARTAAG